jgi:hypothetical protein
MRKNRGIVEEKSNSDNMPSGEGNECHAPEKL